MKEQSNPNDAPRRLVVTSAVLTLALITIGAVRLFPAFSSAGSSSTSAPVVFTDIAKSAGINFIHDNAATDDKYLIETMGSGCGWIDYDNDGFMDLYLVNGSATQLYKPKQRVRSALYHNNGDGTFTDVTDRTGVGADGLFGMGVAVGDYDNDGFPDLYVVGYDHSILYHNNGDGTFTDVTARARVRNDGKWGSSAAWFDYDHDGKLDLVIANYVKWSPETNVWCGDRKPGYRGYCHPNTYPGEGPTLYHNNGDGTFTDVSQSSGVGPKAGSGLGVVTFDFDNDGWDDIFIANDSRANSLFRNNHDGTFHEMAYFAGIAVSENGVAEAGMGTDAADTTGGGFLDVFVTHLDFEHARLFHNLGDGSFEDATFSAKLGYATYYMSGFGTRFLDYDNDGARDIFMANGHILDNIHLYHAETKYAEPKLMYRNDGRGIFENFSDKLGPDFQTPRVSRGAAVADFDNDGDLDLLVSNNGQAPQLFRNDGGNSNNWLEVFLIGSRSNRDGIGARVKVVAGDLVQYDARKGGMSYQSAQDPRLHFGLGSRQTVDVVEVRWPSGLTDVIKNVAVNHFVTVKEGVGQVPRLFPAIKAR
jgi:hypothetical protein